MKKALIPIIILTFCAIVISVCFYIKGEPVETETEAIAIAKEHVTKKYHGKEDKNYFLECEVKATKDIGVWQVCFYTPQPKEEGKRILGSVGPLVIIDQETGRIIYCSKIIK